MAPGCNRGQTLDLGQTCFGPGHDCHLRHLCSNFVLPVLSVPGFLAYEHRMGVEQQKFEHNRPGVLPQIYGDMFGWEGIAQRVAAFYRQLPPDEQRNTAIFANNYGVAGAIDFFGPKYGLPQSYRRTSELIGSGARVNIPARA